MHCPQGIPFRFSETEGIAAITMLVSRYKIEVKEEPEFHQEDDTSLGVTWPNWKCLAALRTLANMPRHIIPSPSAPSPFAKSAPSVQIAN